MRKEKAKLEDQITQAKLEQLASENLSLPKLRVKSKEEALDEILTKTTITGPVHVAENFEA